MLGLHLNAASIEGNLRVLAIGAHPDDIEIGCGATVLRLAEAYPEAEILLGRPDRRAASVRRRLGGALPTSRPASAHRGSSSGDFRDAFLPVRGRRGQGVLREPQVGVRSGSDPHSSARRPAPGPPAGLRADVEHVARPPDPRVRDSQVRRRSRCAEPVRPSGATQRCSGRSTCYSRHFGSQLDRRWFTEDLFRHCFGCAGWSRTRRPGRLRRSTAGSWSSSER